MSTPYRASSLAPLFLLVTIACAPAVGTTVGTTTTTAAAVTTTTALGAGSECLRDAACHSGFCDHPMGFCELPGICRDVLSCSSSGQVGTEGVRASNGICMRAGIGTSGPGACLDDLEELRTKPPRFTPH